MQEIENLNIETSEKDLIAFCRNIPLVGHLSPEVRAMYQNYAINLLGLKQQKRLLEDQRGSSRKLIVATWALAGATIVLVVVDLIAKY